MKTEQIWAQGDHIWYVFCRDPEKSEHVIDTNEYLLLSGDEGMMMDPGGTEIFPQVVGAVAQTIPIEKISYYLASHQDPDILSSLPLWLGLTPKAKIYMSWLWTGFIAHFGHEHVEQFVPVADEGIDITFRNGRSVTLVPAHYCHSSGNFSLYDPRAKLLFSGDIGAALLPPDHERIYVEDFDQHVQYMEGFHRRWMPSNSAKQQWIDRVRALDVEFLCPQHGAIFRGENVKRFLDWFEALEVGSAVERR